MFDLYNVFNDSAPLQVNNQYGSPSGGGMAWQRPQLIIPGRLAAFAFQIGCEAWPSHFSESSVGVTRARVASRKLGDVNLGEPACLWSRG